MKNLFFNSTLILLFFALGCLSVNAQVRVKKNIKSNNINKKVIVKTNSNSFKGNNKVVIKNNRYNKNKVKVKNNRNRVVLNRPNRPKFIRKKPNYNRAGYYWVEGFWKWNVFFGTYSWHKARWIKVKPNHYWVPGFWEITPNGFFWVQGYWELVF